MIHQLVEINPVGARHYDQPGGVFVVRFVTQVFHHGQLFGLHLHGDLLQDFCRRNLVGQGGDHDFTIFFFPNRAHFHRSVAAFVEFQQILGWGDNFCIGRIIRALDVFAQLGNTRLGLVQQADAG